MTYAGPEMLVDINRGDLKKPCLVALPKSGHLKQVYHFCVAR